MILRGDAVAVFRMNIERTNLLIEAVDKISTYNCLYIDKLYGIDPGYSKMVKSVQDEQLQEISKSCYEHAVISICTAFETYLQVLVQELMSEHGDYFLVSKSKWRDQIESLIQDDEYYDFETILDKLDLRNRFQIITFLEKYDINLFTPDQNDFIRAIYIQRNNFVHNGSALQTKAKKQINNLNDGYWEKFIKNGIKVTRTKFIRMIHQVHKKVIHDISECEN